jgi:hypothetical protein
VLIRRPIRDWAADVAFTTAAALIGGVFVLTVLTTEPPNGVRPT